MIFDKILYDDISNISWGVFIFGAASIVIPFYQIVAQFARKLGCFKSNYNSEQNFKVHYDKFRLKFLTEYDRSNPITSSQAMKDYFVFLSGRLVLTDSQL